MSASRTSGIRLARVFGIELRLDWSVLLIFALIVASLGTGVFPLWHPDWSPALVWIVALAAGLLFFASLLAHELSHSLVAKRHGIDVPRITLFLFGGAAEMASEPPTPSVEFRVAIAGPIMSAVLGIGFTVLSVNLAGREFSDALVANPEQAIASLSPLATVLFWLGPVNLVLAIFNMIPGFPLDGGRVLRALLWGWTGDQLKATRWASEAGRIFAWILMGGGVVYLLGGAAVQGIWLILIGWFLSHMAQSSYTQLVMQRALGRLHVRDLMRTRFDTVDANVPLPRFVDEYLLRSGQAVWPVRDGERIVGVVSLAQLTEVPAERRNALLARDVMTPLDRLAAVDPELAGRAAFERVSSGGDEPVPVLEGNTLVGFLHRSDILRWLSLHGIAA